MHQLVERVDTNATGTTINFITPREEEEFTESEVEVLMNMEPFPEVVEISSKLIEPEKDRELRLSFLIEKNKN
jgi:ATP-dependent RNA helicase RhlE